MATIIQGALPPPKQIRFVNNQGQPPSKRRRINAACLTCRKRKTRCAGERPICTTCSKNGHKCLGYNDLLEKKNHHGGGSARDRSRSDDDDYLDEEDDDVKREYGDKTGTKPFTSINGDAEARRGSDETHKSPTLAVTSKGERQGRDWERTRQPERQKPSRTSSGSEAGPGASGRSPLQLYPEINHKVPYFRYFGPTAIVPGFKQMIVSVKDRRRSNAGSFSATSPSSTHGHAPYQHTRDIVRQPLAKAEEDPAEELPSYDPNDSTPVDPLIVDLVKTFFLHVGCNYPFLKEKKFLRMVEEKRVEPILVDAVCALAARFSEHPAITGGKSSKLAKSEYGNVFAVRARAATVDTFPCPSVGAVQAFLLLAYEGFGANQDSTLWMYLGLAMRMAEDLGLQKVVGVKYQGEKDPWYTRHWTGKSSDVDSAEVKPDEDGEPLSETEQKEIEQERIDTFWAIFMLDRVISSGTGRPVRYRDNDVELPMPDPQSDRNSGWPAPFPIFLRIIHLYGRVSDVLNSITDAKDLTHAKMDRLREMERELTNLYQHMDPRLHLTAEIFKAYVKLGQGTNFILLHIWFHTLIIVLHQPALLHSFWTLGETPQLLPSSRELAMSSARTIADTLVYAEFIDPKSFIGNPFTSQPMYMAACAFLMESAANASQPASRAITPPPDGSKLSLDLVLRRHPSRDAKPPQKHSLLASAANQNYQQCYHSLQQLNTYWGGVRYILTALDQKSEGIWDCETYTREEYESTMALFRGSMRRLPSFKNPASPNALPFGVSLTGTTDSTRSEVTFISVPSKNSTNVAPMQPLPPPAHATTTSESTPRGSGNRNSAHQNLASQAVMYPPTLPPSSTPATSRPPQPGMFHRLPGPSAGGNTAQAKAVLGYEALAPDDVTASPSAVDATPNMAVLGSMHAPYAPTSQPSTAYEASMLPAASSTGALADAAAHQQQHQQQHHLHHHYDSGASDGGVSYIGSDGGHLPYGAYVWPGMGVGTGTDEITMVSHEVELDSLGLQSDLPWYEMNGPDVMNMFHPPPSMFPPTPLDEG